MLDKEGYRPNVGIILANSRNEVFWGKRVNQHAWQFPQGGIKHGETPVQAMYRELEEEIGSRAAHFEPLLTFFTTPGFTDEVIHIFLATGLSPGRQHLDHDEVLEVVEMPLEVAIARIADGTIRDGKTIVGLQAVYLRRQQQTSSG